MDANLTKQKLCIHKLQNQFIKALQDVTYLTDIFNTLQEKVLTCLITLFPVLRFLLGLYIIIRLLDKMVAFSVALEWLI